MKFVGIIPARYGSSRFEGKPLVDICGKPMVVRVYEQSIQALDEVYVATDDQRIYDVVCAHGGKAIMTSSQHRSGTDRCYEAYCISGSNADVVINIQGDEPFIQPSQIETLKQCFDTSSVQIATLCRPVDESADFESIFDANKVKVVYSEITGEALYFSRSFIPYLRGVNHEQWLKSFTYYLHIGMYAYRADILADLTRLPQGRLEKAESLEQLRWLENGYHIRIGQTNLSTIGIDTPEDLTNAINWWKNQHNN